jgi:amino acid adenylation domain-containing protein
MPDTSQSGPAEGSLAPIAVPGRLVRVVPEDGEPSIPARFERQARLHPERLAVADDAQALSYRQLNGLANRIAHAVLAARGTGAEPVALLVGDGAPAVAAMLAVLKAGKFYVVLDASQPAARTAAILAECRPGLLITDGERRDRAEALRPGGVPVLDLAALEPSLSEEDPGLDVPTTALAYVVYTSGSTGRPKGVMQDHRYVLHLTQVYTEGGRFTSADRLALLYSPSFAGAVRDIHCALLNGAALLRYDVKREGLTSLADWLRRERITAFFAVASMFRHFCRLLGPEDRFPSVRLVELGSETVRAGDVHLFQRHFGGACRLMVNLGGSEISPVCQFPVGAGTRVEGSTVPAGYAAEGVELLLWDDTGKPVAAGEVGELVVRSRWVARGYWGRPELTKAAFLPDPEGGERRLYRTGDLGRLLPDGCLLHLGRRDLQVKIRGYRVEPAEVEAFFTSTGFVAEAAVTAWPDATGEQNLAAWLVPAHPDAPPSTSDLRALAAEALPDYMVPASLVLLDALPVTAGGKLDRGALPDPRLDTAQHDAPGDVPETAIERRLHEIWSGLLGRKRIGRNESFFDLGGHSLLAVQVIARVAAELRVTLPLHCLFACSTLARLGEAVERARAVEGDERMAPVPRGADVPLSLAQQRLWVLAGMGEPGEAFTLLRAFRLDGTLDPVALERALASLGRRHESLRTSFPMVGDRPVQRIAPACGRVLSFVDLRHVPESRRLPALEGALRAAHARPFELVEGPPWRVQVIRLAGNQHVLHLAMHHLISDDWSVQILLRELSTAYRACLAGQEDARPALPVQYADYAAWQRRRLAGTGGTEQLDYWRDHLRGAPPVTALPLDRPRQACGEFRAGLVPLDLGAELTARLRHLGRESETTLFVTLLAAYAVLLSRPGGPGDVVIGTGFANRYPVETEALIGFFVNTLALRLSWRKDATFREILAGAHRTAVNGYAHTDVPFDHVVEALRPDRTALHSPVFQALFVLQDASRQELALPGLAVTPLDLARPSAGATYDLSLSLRESGGVLAGALEFNAALFDPATAEALATQLQTLLAEVARAPDATPGPPPGERRGAMP